MVDVEKRAILAIEEPLSLCPRLVAYIDTNDKTPVTDGFIVMYEGLSRKKEEIVDRVDVQIKGRTAKQKLAAASFPMTRVELEAVQRIGTVLLFVVFVRPDGSYLGNPRYAILSPFTVDSFLAEMKRKTRTFSVPLRELSDDVSELERIVGIAARTKRQSIFAGSGHLVLERSKSFTISSARDLDFDQPVLISPRTGDFAIEAETPEGLMIPIPGEMQIYPASYTERPLDALFRCGAIEYANATTRQVDPTHHEIKFSDGLKLTNIVHEGKLETGTFSLTLVDNLAQRVKDIDFVLSVASGEPLYLNNHELKFEFRRWDQDHELRVHRAHLERLLPLFDVLHVNAELIQMDAVTEDQHEQLGYLYGAFLEGRSLSSAETGSQTANVYVHIGPWRLHLLLMPDASARGGIPIDLYDPTNRDKFRLYSTDESGAVVDAQATVYDMLAREDVPLILNLNLSALIDAYEAISEAPNKSWLANRTVLRLIHAADDCDDRNTEFLDAAHALNDWLEAMEGPSVPATLNRYQIKARRPEGLTKEDKSSIRAVRREILRSRGDTAMGEAGCAILLDDAGELADCLGRLSEDEQRDFKSYPIWTLHEKRGG